MSQLSRILLRTLGKLVAFSVRKSVRQFEHATLAPEPIQAELLRQFLAHHADTAFGRDHGFASIRTIADYRRQVPVAAYDYFEPYIARVRKGETKALLADPKVLMFALTSGTTASRKYIPVTQRYLDDYRRGWNVWGLQAWRGNRFAMLKPMVQLAGDPEEFRTEAGIPCGNLSGLTAEAQKKIVRWLYCVPPGTGRVKDAAARHYVSLRFSVPRKAGMFVAANPSSLIALARVLDERKEALIDDVAKGTLDPKLDIPDELRARFTRKVRPDPEAANRLKAAVKAGGGTLLPMHVWQPEKVLIGTWTGGSVGPYLRQLPRYFGTTAVRDLGLLASEGRMTIPFANDTPAGILDVTTHYFEFIPEGEIDAKQPTVLGAHELAEGGNYYILPTTAAGLYRYHICDLVRVTGFFNKTPLVQFLSKGNRIASLTGEKLSEYQVTLAVEDAVRRTGLSVHAYSVAPCWDDRQPYYGLFVEETDLPDGAARFLAELDRCLGERNIEYQAKRESGRLGPVRLELLPAGFWPKWDRERLAKTGGSPEQYKHPCLIGDVNFRAGVPVLREVPAGGVESAPPVTV
jgi:hypothetical protein